MSVTSKRIKSKEIKWHRSECERESVNRNLIPFLMLRTHKQTWLSWHSIRSYHFRPHSPPNSVSIQFIVEYTLRVEAFTGCHIMPIGMRDIRLCDKVIIMVQRILLVIHCVFFTYSTPLTTPHLPFVSYVISTCYHYYPVDLIFFSSAGTHTFYFFFAWFRIGFMIESMTIWIRRDAVVSMPIHFRPTSKKFPLLKLLSVLCVFLLVVDRFVRFGSVLLHRFLKLSSWKI